MLTTRKFFAFSFTIVFFLLVTVWINSFRITDHHTATNEFKLKPFHTKNLWGAKLISEDGSHKLFAGIQNGLTGLDGKINNLITPQKEILTATSTNNHQLKIRINLGIANVFFKILSYNQPLPVKEPTSQANIKAITQLNYIVKNNPCRKCSKDDVFNKTFAANPYSSNISDSKTVSVYGVIIQIIPK